MGKKAKKPIGETGQVIDTLRRHYEQVCQSSLLGSNPVDTCQSLVLQMKHFAEENMILQNFAMRVASPQTTPSHVCTSGSAIGTPKSAVAGEGETPADQRVQEKVERPRLRNVSLAPLVSSMRSLRYAHLRNFVISAVQVDNDSAIDLALLIEKRIFQLEVLELVNCMLSAYAAGRLARSIKGNESLKIFKLDHNGFGDEGCRVVSEGLSLCKYLTTLSMEYCDLGVESGAYLAPLVITSSVSDLSLTGNSLQCQGVVSLLSPLTNALTASLGCCYETGSVPGSRPGSVPGRRQDHCDTPDRPLTVMSSIKSREISINGELTDDNEEIKSNKTSKPKKLKKKSSRKIGNIGTESSYTTYLRSLKLADNGIDDNGEDGKFGPIQFAIILSSFIKNCPELVELDLTDNLIGDMAGCQLLGALRIRVEAGDMPLLKVKTTHRLRSQTFQDIIAISLKGKKRKGKGKKSKKKK